LKGKVVVENPKRPVVVQCAEKIQRFHIIGARFGRMTDPNMEVPQIDERMGDGVGILLDPLKVQDFPIAAFGSREIVKQRTGIAQVAERTRQFLDIIR
jgi:hypothetical protein